MTNEAGKSFSRGLMGTNSSLKVLRSFNVCGATSSACNRSAELGSLDMIENPRRTMSGRECFMVVPEQRINRVREASRTGCRFGGASSNHSVSYNHELHESPRMKGDEEEPRMACDRYPGEDKECRNAGSQEILRDGHVRAF